MKSQMDIYGRQWMNRHDCGHPLTYFPLTEFFQSPVNLSKCSLAVNCPSAVDSAWMGADERQTDRCVAIISLGFLSSFIPPAQQ